MMTPYCKLLQLVNLYALLDSTHVARLNLILPQGSGITSIILWFNITALSFFYNYLPETSQPEETTFITSLT
jgi:hypothetical protein